MILKIDKTNISPDIIFDTSKNNISIVGRMIMENAIEYFIEVKSNLKFFEENADITLFFDVDYINSSSMSQLLKLLRNEKRIKVIDWYYVEHDSDSKKTGQIFDRMLTDVKINIYVKDDE